MAVASDLYEILGISPDASQEEIKRAYRKLAREHHPDVSGDPATERRFKEIAGAYEILSDPGKRRQYDLYGAQGGPGGSPFADVQDIFDLFFGQGGFGGGFGSARRTQRRPSRTARGEDLHLELRLSFEEAAFGVVRELEVERAAACDRCLGNGAEPGTAPTSCRTCGGTGQVQEVRRSIFGQLVTAQPCRTCRGTGLEITAPCERCSGEGRVLERAAVPLEVPAGVADAMDMRVPGQGHAGVAGGNGGDLYVTLRVDPSPVFERSGQDLFAVLEVAMTQATLGADLDVETLDGVETVRVEPGTESGEVIRLRGRGVPNLQRRGRGDLYLTVRVRTPSQLKRDQRRLLEQLAELRDEPAGKGARDTRTLRHPAAE